MTEKIGCTKCGEFKDRAEFYDDKRNFDGLCNWCKECTLAYQTAYYAQLDNPVVPGRYRCSRCKKRKSHKQFHKSRRYKNGLAKWCKACVADSDKLRNIKIKYGFQKGSSHEVRKGDHECIKCGEIKPHTEFNRDKRNRKGLKGTCRECELAYMREYNARRRVAQAS